MKEKLIKIYQILGVIAAFVAVAEVAVFYFLLAPGFKQLKKAEQNLNAARSQMRNNDWPLDLNKLEKIKKEYKNKLESEDEEDNAISFLSDKALKKAGNTFQAVITRDYSKLADFMRNASRLDYQTEHNRVFSHLAKRGYILNPQEVGLDENSPSPYVYQLLLHLWTLEKVINLAADNGLTLETTSPQTKLITSGKSRNQRNNKQMTSETPVHILPMKAYSTAQDNAPYLLEFPLQIRLQGNLSAGKNFMDCLQKDDVFIPVTAFELFSLPPSPENKTEKILFNLECSSFLPLTK